MFFKLSSIMKSALYLFLTLGSFLNALCQTSEDYFNKGLEKYRHRDYSGAIQDYSKAIEIDSNNATAYNNRGHTKYQLQDFTGAIEDYSRAIAINPKYSTAYKSRGDAKSQILD